MGSFWSAKYWMRLYAGGRKGRATCPEAAAALRPCARCSALRRGTNVRGGDAFMGPTWSSFQTFPKSYRKLKKQFQLQESFPMETHAGLLVSIELPGNSKSSWNRTAVGWGADSPDSGLANSATPVVQWVGECDLQLVQFTSDRISWKTMS